MPDDAITHTSTPVIAADKAVCLSHIRIITERPTERQREGVIPDGGFSSSLSIEGLL
jgi:hypothetical protein